MLRDQRFACGDIAVILAIAAHLNGGDTDANVARVAKMRLDASRSWAAVARHFGISPTRVAVQVEKLHLWAVTTTAPASRPPA